MKRFLSLALLALAAPVAAQVDTLSFLPRTYAVGSLPTCDAAHHGFAHVVYDGADGADCSSGSGADVHWCLCDGSAWIAVRMVADLSLDGAVTINESGADVDFRVEGTGAANALFVDGANGRVGIGTATPSARLSVVGTGGSASGLEVKSTNEAVLLYLNSDAAGASATLSYNGSGGSELVMAASGYVYLTPDSGKRTGVGTTSPAVRLDVRETTDTDVIRLQDSDGTCDGNPESGSVTWTCSSTERRKVNVRQPDIPAILARLASIPLATYETLETGETKHGPIAEVLRVTHPEMVVERPEREECSSVEGVEACVTVPAELAVEVPSAWELVAAIKALAGRVAALEARPGPPRVGGGGGGQ